MFFKWERVGGGHFPRTPHLCWNPGFLKYFFSHETLTICRCQYVKVMEMALVMMDFNCDGGGGDGGEVTEVELVEVEVPEVEVTEVEVMEVKVMEV